MNTHSGRKQSLSDRVKALAREAGLWRAGDRILVALSGGADSTALLHLLSSLAESERLELLAAHVNYGLRGEDSDGDETFCQTLCESLGVPLHVLRPTDAPKGNVQAWARRVRQTWFADLARKLSCDHIALAHSANDRAETVILQMLRGASRKGVANMQAKRGRLIRPLITTERDEIESYLSQHDIAFRTDAGNASPKYRRNRVRHEVLPLLSDVFAKNAVITLCETARLFGLESDYLEQEAARHHQLLEPAPGGLRIPTSELLNLHPALALRLLWSALSQLGIGPGRERVFRLLDLAGRPAGKRLKLGAWGTAERGREHLWFYSARADLPELSVCVPGVTPLPDGSLLRVERSKPVASYPTGHYEMTAQLPDPAQALRLRAARSGDRMRPFGSKGSRLVFDLLAEAGVPRFLRTQSWVLSQNERILWLLGHRPAEEIRALPGSGELYQFRWETDSKR